MAAGAAAGAAPKSLDSRSRAVLSSIDFYVKRKRRVSPASRCSARHVVRAHVYLLGRRGCFGLRFGHFLFKRSRRTRDTPVKDAFIACGTPSSRFILFFCSINIKTKIQESFYSIEQLLMQMSAELKIHKHRESLRRTCLQNRRAVPGGSVLPSGPPRWVDTRPAASRLSRPF